MHGNRVQRTRFSNAVVRFQQPKETNEPRCRFWPNPAGESLLIMCKNDEIQAPIGRVSLRFASPEAFATWVWSDRRLGFIVFASLRRRDTSDEAFCIAWSFHRLGLVRIGTWVHSLLLSSSFLNSLGCWNLTTALLNRVRWARFPCMKIESVGLGFHAWKPSPVDSISLLRNRVQWTRFLAYVANLTNHKSSPLNSNC